MIVVLPWYIRVEGIYGQVLQLILWSMPEHRHPVSSSNMQPPKIGMVGVPSPITALVLAKFCLLVFSWHPKWHCLLVTRKLFEPPPLDCRRLPSEKMEALYTCWIWRPIVPYKDTASAESFIELLFLQVGKYYSSKRVASGRSRVLRVESALLSNFHWQEMINTAILTIFTPVLANRFKALGNKLDILLRVREEKRTDLSVHPNIPRKGSSV